MLKKYKSKRRRQETSFQEREEAPPAEEILPIQEIPPVEEVPPIQEIPPVEEAPPAEEVPPIQEIPPVEKAPKEIFSPTSYSFSSVEVKTLETDVTTPGSREDVMSTPSATVSPPEEQQATLTLIPALNEIVRSLPDTGNSPIVSHSPYGGVGTDAPKEQTPATSVLTERDPLIDPGTTGRRHRPLGSDEPTDLEFSTRQNSINDDPPSVHRPTFKERYFAFSTRAVDSWYNVPFLLMLMGMFCFAIYMGGAYYDKCTLVKHLPMFYLLMGVVGILGVSARIVHILYKKEKITGCGDVKYGAGFATLVFTGFYLYENIDFIYKRNFTTEQRPDYCDPFFYTYAYWSNWTILVTVIILAVIHLPAVCRATMF